MTIQATSNETPAKRIVHAFPYAVDIVEHAWITLSDRTRLAARIWYPNVKRGERLPAILEYIPYRKRDGTRTRDEPMHGYIAGHGYVVVRVDMRGSGESDGLLRDEYLQQEQDDALEVIEWISRQAWCDGKVGMMGKSWGGFNSLQVAALRPPALKAIVVVGFTDDRYNEDIHFKGGCLLNDNFWWGAIMLAYQARPLDPALVGDAWRAAWLERLRQMPLWPALWLAHQTRDEYWKHGSVGEDYSAIRVPVLAVDGWADSYTNSVLSLLAGLQVPCRGIIGPWAHVYAHDGTPGPAIGFLQETVAWWDHWLKGIDNGAMSGPKVQAWIEDGMAPRSCKPVSRGHWYGIDSWPTPDVSPTPWTLTRGRLAACSVAEASRHEPVTLRTPLNHGQYAGEWMGAGVPGECAPDQRPDDGMAMVFDGDALEAPMMVFGYPAFTVELASDVPAAMLFAALSDVHPDGSVERVAYGVMNLTHVQGHDRVVPLTPGQRVPVRVDLDCCGHAFAAGHRVRLSLATSYWPMFWPMPRDATLTLDLGSARLLLPVFNGTRTVGPNPQPECAALTPTTLLRAGKVDRTATYDLVTNTWTAVTDGVGGVFGEGIYRFDDIDTTVEHNLKRVLTLSNDDPLSARYEIIEKMRIGREGWWIEADIRVIQSSTLETFVIRGSMDVTENGAPAFSRSWDQAIPRNGI